jgi:hypothetical protein
MLAAMARERPLDWGALSEPTTLVVMMSSSRSRRGLHAHDINEEVIDRDLIRSFGL